MKKDYLKPDTLDVVFTAGCLDPLHDPNNPSSSGGWDPAPARRPGAGPAINY